MVRSAGVLLNVSSLPSKYGIGGFGKPINELCGFLKRGGFHYWQILPVTTIGWGDSPYSGTSAFAGNYLYIDPESLFNEGLLSRGELDACTFVGADYAVDYNAVRAAKSRMLRAAYNNGGRSLGDRLRAFEVTHGHWLRQYAVYMTLKDEYDGLPWYRWDARHRDGKALDFEAFIADNEDKYYYYVFEQYVFDRQWNEAKNTLAFNGIRIMGDMPMYVCHDSADVWGNPDDFLLDANGMPKEVAGVPPDYFSADGQLWGNPLYDYKRMEKHGFGWWLDRFARMFELYDVLRIDHFRAFSQYWAVDADAKTAKGGHWCEGAGMKLFDKAFERFDKERFVAEDLGIIDDKVRELLAETGLPGMRVMQFGFEDGDSVHLPHNFTRNCVGYTATHDNDTTLGWMFSLKDDILDYVLRYTECDARDWSAGGSRCPAVRAFSRRLIASCCKLAIIPFQDICGYGGDCRMNTPGVADGNWRFRATKQAMDGADMEYYHYINSLYGRNRTL